MLGVSHLNYRPFQTYEQDRWVLQKEKGMFQGGLSRLTRSWGTLPTRLLWLPDSAEPHTWEKSFTLWNVKHLSSACSERNTCALLSEGLSRVTGCKAEICDLGHVARRRVAGWDKPGCIHKGTPEITREVTEMEAFDAGCTLKCRLPQQAPHSGWTWGNLKAWFSGTGTSLGTRRKDIPLIHKGKSRSDSPYAGQGVRVTARHPLPLTLGSSSTSWHSPQNAECPTHYVLSLLRDY